MAKKESLMKDIGDTMDMPDTILGWYGLFYWPRGGLILVSITDGPSISFVLFFFKFSRENIWRRFDFCNGGLGAGFESITNNIDDGFFSKTIEDLGDLSYSDKL